MIRITAHERDAAFQAINSAMEVMSYYRDIRNADDRAFERDVLRECICVARALRLAGVDYPSIP